jgi:hypothetical protein
LPRVYLVSRRVRPVQIGDRRVERVLKASDGGMKPFSTLTT